MSSKHTKVTTAQTNQIHNHIPNQRTHFQKKNSKIQKFQKFTRHKLAIGEPATLAPTYAHAPTTPLTVPVK